MPAIHDIDIHRRNSWQLDVTLLDSNGAAIDLTGSSFTATIFRGSSGPGLAVTEVTGTLVDAGAGEARVSLDADATGALPPGRFRWELEWTDAQGEPWDLLAGQANVSDQQQGQQVDVVELTVTSEQVTVEVQLPGTQGPAGPEGPTGPAESHGNEDHDVTFATEDRVERVAPDVFNVRSYGAVGDGVTGDLSAIQAACQAATDAGGGVVYFPEGTWNVEGGLSLSTYDCTLLGAGTNACIIKAVSQTGYVIDFTGWVGQVPNNSGKVLFGRFQVQGDGAADATKAKGGIDFADQASGLHVADVGIIDTGGPAASMGAMWGAIFDGVVFGRPVGADTNDVPYLHITDWLNGCLFSGCGFRSVTSDLDGSSVVLIEADAATSHDTRWMGTWAEFQHLPEGGTFYDVTAHSMIFDGLQIFDGSQDAGAAETSWYLIRAGNGNQVLGEIPGRGTTTTGVRYGVIVEGAAGRTRIVGTRGYKDNNVLLKSGTEYNYIELGGQRSGTLNADAVIDNSGNDNNVVIDATGGRYKMQVEGFDLDSPADQRPRIPAVEESTTSRTLALSDAGKVVEATHANTTTITVPPESSVAFPDGTVIDIYAAGAGGVAIVEGSGVTIRNLDTVDHHGEISLRKRSTDVWVLRRRAEGVPFSPLSIAWSAAFWAEDPDWTNPGDGNPVSSWRNAGSGDFGAAVQATGSKQPTYVASDATLNSKPAVQFDATDDILETPAGTALTQPNEIMFVAYAGPADTSFMDGITGTARHLVQRRSADWRLFAGSLVEGGTPDGDAHLFRIVVDGASSLVEVDGTTVASSDAGSHDLTGIVIGNDNAELTSLDGAVAFLGVVDGALTAQERSDLKAWAADHYGITVA